MPKQSLMSTVNSRVGNSFVVRIARFVKDFLMAGPVIHGLFYALGALAFGLGMVLMANSLDPETLGFVALFLALLRLGGSVGPIGLDVLLIRARPDSDVLPFQAILLSSLFAALCTLALVRMIYPFDTQLLVLLLAGFLAATYLRMFIALDQARQRPIQALVFQQVPSLIALLMGLVAFYFGLVSTVGMCAVAVAGYLVAAASRLTKSHARNLRRNEMRPEDWKFSDRLSLAGLAVVGVLIGWAERFLIPRVLSFEELATYATVASVAVAPVKLLSAASQFYLVPLLVSARSAQAFRRVLVTQCLGLVICAVVASAAVLVVSPWLWPRLLPPSFIVDHGLVAAILAVAFARLWQGIAVTILRARGGSRLLGLTNFFAVVCIICAAMAAVTYSSGQLTRLAWIMAAGIAGYALIATVLALNIDRGPDAAEVDKA
jgi:O-antigen/teichoic acid export membrane protein